MTLEAAKTKPFATSLQTILNMNKGAKRYDVLLVAANAGAANKNLFRASSNLQKAKALDAASLNVYDIVNHKNLFLDKEAVETIAKHYSN